VISLLPYSFGDAEFQDNIRAIPEVIWDVHEVILDGTIIDSNNKTWIYDIKVNQVFKGPIKSDLISVEGFDVWNNFTRGDRALFYIYDISSVSNYKYKVTDYSVKTTTMCDARSLIQISPILPNDPIKIVRGHPDIPANWRDPCVPSYFGYDPDFFNFRDPVPPKMQLRHNIPIDLIRCYDDKILIHKMDYSPACVKPTSISKIVERGWALGETIPIFEYIIKKEGVTYGSSYQVVNGIVDEIIYDNNSNSLIVSLSESEKGFLQIVIQTGVLHMPRDLPFTYFVLIDGEEVEFEELTPIMLKIPFDKGTKQIEIIGANLT
jgi:hypothetical protein